MADGEAPRSERETVRAQHPAPDVMQWFSFEHLPEPLRSVSERFHTMAHELVATLPPNRERTKALDFLLLAKDAAVRASKAK